MYVGDKKRRITVRLSDKQFTCISFYADKLGFNVSEFIRLIVLEYVLSVERV